MCSRDYPVGSTFEEEKLTADNLEILRLSNAHRQVVGKGVRANPIARFGKRSEQVVAWKRLVVRWNWPNPAAVWKLFAEGREVWPVSAGTGTSNYRRSGLSAVAAAGKSLSAIMSLPGSARSTAFLGQGQHWHDALKR